MCFDSNISYSISNLHLLSIYTAVELFHIKVSPVASYGIEMIWPFLSYRDLNNIEAVAVKSRYLKRLLCVSKYSKSRLVYELIGEKYFLEELKVKSK
jgi:hypothetical protein